MTDAPFESQRSHIADFLGDPAGTALTVCYIGEDGSRVECVGRFIVEAVTENGVPRLVDTGPPMETPNATEPTR